MRDVIKTLIKMIFGIIIGFVLLIGGAQASLFGEENALLSKILLEDMQHTFNLKNLVKLAGNDLKILNEKYGYDRWINKGLDQIKDYGYLEHLKTDDFVLGTLQYNMGNVGLSMNGDDYIMNNVDEWIDQVWGKAPELLNSATKYPGSLSEWKIQEENNLPGLSIGSGSMRDMVNRGNAQLSYKHALWNMAYNEKIKQTYADLLMDAQESNPGEANRITAQSNAMQNIQLGRMDNTQSAILRLMAQKQLNNIQNQQHQSQSLVEGISGVVNLFQTAPTFLK